MVQPEARPNSDAVEHPEWESARELLDFLDATPAGKYMASQPDITDSQQSEPQMLKANHIADSINKLVVVPGTPKAITLERLGASGKIRFTMQPYLINGIPAPDGLVHPELEGGEVQKQDAAEKIHSFLEKHDRLIRVLQFQPGNVQDAVQLERDEVLPEGYAKRIKATSLITTIEDAKKHGLPKKIKAAESALEELRANGIKPLSEAEILELLDATIEKDIREP